MNRYRADIVVGAVAYDPKVVTIWDLIREQFLAAGLALDYVLFSNYEAQVTALLNRFLDIAWNTNVAYVHVQNALGRSAKILGMRDTDVGYTSKIVVRTDSGIRQLGDLTGKRLALGSRDSGQAAILPTYFLAINGLEPGRDLDVLRFDLDVGKHGDTGTSEYAVIDAVRSRRADAGAIGHSTWIRMLETGYVNGEEIEAIWTSPAYSHCNFTALPDFDETKAQQFTEVLLSMDPRHPDVKRVYELEGLNAWVRGDGSGYEALFAAMERFALP
jgi:phosphonate transport system substrate-binding protein